MKKPSIALPVLVLLLTGVANTSSAQTATVDLLIGAAAWGKSVDTLRLVDEARARGVDVTIDQYPYTASSTSVQTALLPAWALEGGRERLLQRMKGAVRSVPRVLLSEIV